MKRVLLTKNHLASPPSFGPSETLQAYRKNSKIDAKAVREIYFGKYTELHEKIINFLANDKEILKYNHFETERQEKRYIFYKQMRRLAQAFPFKLQDYTNDPSLVCAFYESLVEHSLSLATKFLIQYGIYARALINLGSEKHIRLMERALQCEDTGCFALTELAHGSNLRTLKTRADYDHTTREFVINSPTNEDMKIWTGGAGKHATFCIVWAQLYINEKGYGIHPFVVRIRTDTDHELVSGVIVGDCGKKIGLDGLDQGFILFKDFRVPYDCLLDKYCSIDENGIYNSPIKNADKRFGTFMSSLTLGRISIASASLNSMRIAIIIAGRFAYLRRQFGAPHNEIPIIEYPLTQYRLFPYIASMFAINFAIRFLNETCHKSLDSLANDSNPMISELHALSSFIKPYTSWLSIQGIQEARELCGTFGLSAYNRIGEIREDNDASTVVEGENNMLIVQTARFLVVALSSLRQREKAAPFPSLYFLTSKAPEYDRSSDKSAFEKSKYDIFKALETRANYLINSAVNRLMKFERSSSLADNFNVALVYHLRDAVRAYGELFIFNNFYKAIKTMGNDYLGKTFHKLFELYAYHLIEKDLVTFLEMGYMKKHDTIFVKEKVLSLCQEIKPEIIGLIDALAPPDEVLRSPIASQDGDAYNHFAEKIQQVNSEGHKILDHPEIVKGEALS